MTLTPLFNKKGAGVQTFLLNFGVQLTSKMSPAEIGRRLRINAVTLSQNRNQLATQIRDKRFLRSRSQELMKEFSLVSK